MTHEEMLETARRLSDKLTPGDLDATLAQITTAAVSVPIAFGYHPYLTVPGTPRAEWTVELPVDRRLVLDENHGMQRLLTALDPDARSRAR